MKSFFIGTVPLRDLGYSEIRNLARTTLTTLAKISPNTQHVIVTVHGVRYGLDESESFESQIAGFVDAIKSGEIPERLKIITFAEKI